jgi:hypothetical protein
MKFLRLGSSLALLMAGVACTQSAQSAISPTAASAIVAAATAAADGSTLKVNPPGTVSPADGVRAEDRRPTLIWTNADGKYAGIGLAYDLELSAADKVVYSTTVGETPNFGAHVVPFDLDFDVMYSWRARAHLGDTFGPWSTYATFQAPAKPVAAVVPGGVAVLGACAAPLSEMGPGESRRPRPNGFPIVQQVASAFPGALRNSCQPEGGSWEFMDRVVDSLRATDGRWGYNCKRGNCNDPSLDVVSYYYRPDPAAFQGSNAVYIFDTISGHCGSNPSVFWGDVTDITFQSNTEGKTMYPRPGRVVDTSNCTKK